jgi:hypothetical protein
MPIILPYPVGGHAGTGGDDHHVENLLTRVPARD